MHDDFNSLKLQYIQAIEEIELYSKLVAELRNELALQKDSIITYPIIFDNHFDENVYIKKYPDVLKSGLSPLSHYEKFGKMLGRTCN